LAGVYCGRSERKRRRTMPRRLAVILAGGFVAAGLLVSSAAAGPASPSPRIVAHPESVMVLKTTELTGTHFKASSKITIEECGEENWIVPQNPCDTTSAIKVKTNTKGRFSAVLTVHTCPTMSATPGFDEACYVGEPTPDGIDTVGLEGAVAITVTGP
jgi:hypothetical protein